jgi:hypothetical protein
MLVQTNMQVLGQRVQVGSARPRTIVDLEVEDRSIRLLSEAGEVRQIVAGTMTNAVTRFSPYGSTQVLVARKVSDIN